jgi:hypothetical protein
MYGSARFGDECGARRRRWEVARAGVSTRERFRAPSRSSTTRVAAEHAGRAHSSPRREPQSSRCPVGFDELLPRRLGGDPADVDAVLLCREDGGQLGLASKRGHFASRYTRDSRPTQEPLATSIFRQLNSAHPAVGGSILRMPTTRSSARRLMRSEAPMMPDAIRRETWRAASDSHLGG